MARAVSVSDDPIDELRRTVRKLPLSLKALAILRSGLFDAPVQIHGGWMIPSITTLGIFHCVLNGRCDPSTCKAAECAASCWHCEAQEMLDAGFTPTPKRVVVVEDEGEVDTTDYADHRAARDRVFRVHDDSFEYVR